MSTSRQIHIPRNFAALRHLVSGAIHRARTRYALGVLGKQGFTFRAFDELASGMWDEDTTARSLAEYYRIDPYIVPAVTTVPQIIAKWPRRIMRRRPDGRLDGPVTNTDLHRLLNSEPNEYQSDYEFHVESLIWLNYIGLLYWRTIPPKLQMPTGLWIIDPHRILPERDAHRGVEHWKYSIGGQIEKIPPEEILWTRLFSPTDNLAGQGAGQPLLETLEMRRQGRMFNLNQLRRGGHPDEIYFSAPAGATVTPAQAREFKEKFLAEHSGARNAFNPMFVGQFQPHTLQRTAKDVAYAEMNQQTREDIGSAAQTHGAVIGDMEHATYSNINAQREMVIEYRALPLAEHYLKFVNRHLARRFGPELEMVFDLSAEPVVVERMVQWIERVDKLVNPAGGRPLISPATGNRILAKIMPQFAEEFEAEAKREGMDEIYMPATLTPMERIVNPPPVPSFDIFGGQSGGDDDGDDDDPDRDAPPPDEGELPDADGEPGTEDKATAAERAAIDRLIASVSGSPDIWIPDSGRKVESGVIDGVVYWGEDLRERSTALARALHERLIPMRYAQIVRALGLGQPLNMASPLVIRFIEEKTMIFAQAFPETVVKRVRRVVAEGSNEGLTYQQIANGVNDAFNGMKRNALTVAMTEASAGFNFADHHAYTQSDVVIGREWMPRTERHAHVPGENGTVAIEQPFVVRDAKGSRHHLMYPADPAGPPGEIINCGCSTAPVLDGEAAVRPAFKALSDHDRIDRWARTFTTPLRVLLREYQEQTIAALSAAAAREGETVR